MTAPLDAPLDLVGIGIGPGNLSLAALAHGLPAQGAGELATAFYDERRDFRWHPGLLLDGTTLQGPFLADLVTLADPTSPWTFLNYLRHTERLHPFYLAQQLRIRTAEYDAYCRWVAGRLPALHFGHRVDAVRWNPERDLFEVDHTRLDADGETEALGRTHTRHLALGIGTAPHVPDPLRPLVDAPAVPVIHAADYLGHRTRILGADHITVIGSGQSGAEVFLDLLRARPTGRERLTWLTRTPAFTPREHSTLGLEHFTPDYTRYFHSLPEPVRDQLIPTQSQLHKGIDPATLAAIHHELYTRTLHGGRPDTVLTPGVTVRTAGRVATTKVELHLEHPQQGTRSRLTTDAVILATGYRERPLTRLLAGLDPYLRKDSSGRPRIDEHHRMVLAPTVTGSIFVQNAERHTHGIGTHDLGLTTRRSATILNTLTGKNPYPEPARTTFTTFGLEQREQTRPHPPVELLPLVDCP
ncbi:lysine N(6)-hydroxylase/L-ornithine N(5)-oxygenase family protein [Streptomyces sp. NPDC090445]|uniref:lysine N(6)-hydroxylase/L-ornithine N(5)-oxygenase family protein n=1 Tax=Streptomyces sp. NPDC090445 TaxID=3365963 RepID=UPI0037F5237A